MLTPSKFFLHTAILILSISLGSLCQAADDFTLPPVDSPTPQTSFHGSSLSHLFVDHYQFSGNTVFTDSELREITISFSNRVVTQTELAELRRKLTLHYVENGYINSGAIIPTQKIDDGVVIFQIIEGRLIDIQISGLKHLANRYVQKRLQLGAGPPLNMHTLQVQVRRLHQDPLIRRIKAEIKPTAQRGEAILVVEAEEAVFWRAAIGADNDRSPSVGGNQLVLHAADLNVSGWGDAMGVDYSLAEGLHEIYAYYELPLTARDLKFNFGFKTNRTRVVEEPFDELDIKSESTDFSIGIHRPFWRESGHDLIIGLTAEKRHLETDLLGRGFSFSPGVQKGQADITVIRFYQEWMQPQSNHILALRSVFNIGVDALDATQNESGPDANFFAWLGQVQWAQRLNRLWNSHWVARADMQLAANPLMPMEKFAMGGMGAGSVRGYRKNQLVKDNAFVGSTELRIPVLRLPLPRISKRGYDGTVSIAPFFDMGWGEDVNNPSSDPDLIYSLGFGLRWDISRKVHAYIYYGHGFEAIENISDDLQDQGVHFEVQCSFF